MPTHKLSPVVFDLPIELSVLEAFEKLANWSHPILFASTQTNRKLGRYSFFASEPVARFRLEEPEFGIDPFIEVKAFLETSTCESIPGLPPFQGGAAGVLCYELGRCWEKLSVPRYNEFKIPVAAINIYDWVIAWDHVQHKSWLIVRNQSEKSARQLFNRVSMTINADAQHSVEGSQSKLKIEANTYPLSQLPGLMSNFDHKTYLQSVQRVIDYIYAGDIFQANLSQRLMVPSRCSAVEQFLVLAKQNPAPFGGYYSQDDWAVISSSPERFVQLVEGEVSTRPIKGTRKRRPFPEADLYSRDELRESAKDRAENVMIVDLMRNDLSRVCQPGTIQVPELCTIEAYETVTHLVSEVRGQLRTGATFWDLLQATFPGGSITGAPKIRAMEIITEIEEVARGPYCGSLFYCGYDGTADSNILIRTMIQKDNMLQFPVGGGIVAQSISQQEYEETLHKASGMLRALSNE